MLFFSRKIDKVCESGSEVVRISGIRIFGLLLYYVSVCWVRYLRGEANGIWRHVRCWIETDVSEVLDISFFEEEYGISMYS